MKNCGLVILYRNSFKTIQLKNTTAEIVHGKKLNCKEKNIAGESLYL